MAEAVCNTASMRPKVRTRASGGKVVKAGDQGAQNPVVHIEREEDEQDDGLIEDREHGGIGLGLRVDHGGKRKTHLHAEDLPGKLRRVEDEVEKQPDDDSDEQFVERNAGPAER